jgi:hypothetical protein
MPFEIRRLWLAAILTSLVACDGDDTGLPRTAPVGTVTTLRAVDHVTLEETDEAYVGSIGTGIGVSFRPDGVIAVADGMASRVLFFERSGSLLRSFGGPGDGPGEFRRVRALSWDPEGRLWVAGEARVTVIGVDFDLDSTFLPPDGVESFWSLSRAGPSMLAAEYRYPVQGPSIVAYDRNGNPGIVFMEVPEVDQRPYVLGEYRPRFSASGDTVFAASSTSYPLRTFRLDGTPLDTFGTRPPSIGERTYPEMGAFAGGRQVLGGDWLRMFGTIHSVRPLHDSLIVVEHRRRHPDPGGIPPWSHYLDVYDRWTLEKLAEDVLLPGLIVDVHDDLLWLLTDTPLSSDPPGGPWGFTGFRVEVSAGPDR